MYYSIGDVENLLRARKHYTVALNMQVGFFVVFFGSVCRSFFYQFCREVVFWRVCVFPNARLTHVSVPPRVQAARLNLRALYGLLATGKRLEDAAAAEASAVVSTTRYGAACVPLWLSRQRPPLYFSLSLLLSLFSACACVCV